MSKIFSKCLKLIINHFYLYDKTVFERTGVNNFWIINNSLDFLENLKQLKIGHLETYDFSTLYTSLPHREIRTNFKNIFKKVFSRESKQFINISFRRTYFSSQELQGYKSLTENDLNLILNFILDNIFVKFGGVIYKQIIGIPIGLDSGQDIANLLLYHYESTFLENISKTDLTLARKFKHSKRYIDDLFSANFPDFSRYLPNIYPQELELNLSSDSNTSVNYLDLKIVSINSDLIFSLYDKRDDFSFEIVNFPFLDSCIPRKPSLGIFYGQLIRIARICSKFQDFCLRILRLSERLMNQGYKFICCFYRRLIVFLLTTVTVC